MATPDINSWAYRQGLAEANPLQAAEETVREWERLMGWDKASRALFVNLLEWNGRLAQELKELKERG